MMVPHYSKLEMMTHLRGLYHESPQHDIFPWDEYPDHLMGMMSDADYPGLCLQYYFGQMLTVPPEDYEDTFLFEPAGVKISGETHMTYGRMYG